MQMNKSLLLGEIMEAEKETGFDCLHKFRPGRFFISQVTMSPMPNLSPDAEVPAALSIISGIICLRLQSCSSVINTPYSSYSNDENI